MHKRIVGIAIVAVAAVALVAAPGFTDEEGTDDQGAGWMALGTPGEHHAWLGRLAGTWDVASRFWQGPGEPMESTGRATLTRLWEGRYLSMDYEGDFQGQTFWGRGTWAYNNGMQRFEGTWLDSWSTAIAFSTGQREGDVLTMQGEFVSPMGKTISRDVVTIEGDDRWTMTSHWKTQGSDDEQKVMELVYTRAE